MWDKPIYKKSFSFDWISDPHRSAEFKVKLGDEIKRVTPETSLICLSSIFVISFPYIWYSKKDEIKRADCISYLKTYKHRFKIQIKPENSICNKSLKLNCKRSPDCWVELVLKQISQHSKKSYTLQTCTYMKFIFFWIVFFNKTLTWECKH